MIKDFVCHSCDKGPCAKREDEVRPVWSDFHRSCYHSSDWWKTFDFTGTSQCLEVIFNRRDIFQCEGCGHYFEDYMLHRLTDSTGYEWQYCPDCLERYTQIQKRKNENKVG